MDKKKLARLLAIVGGALLIVCVLLWLIPTISYSEGAMSPLKYFTEGANPKKVFYKEVMLAANPEYNTNQDMYWMFFGVIFSVISFVLSLAKGKSLPVKTFGVIFSVFVLLGVILSPVLGMSSLWALYLVVAILAVASYVASWVLDYFA